LFLAVVVEEVAVVAVVEEDVVVADV